MKCQHKNTVSTGSHIVCLNPKCEAVGTEDQWTTYIERKIAEQEYLDNELPDRISL